MKSIHGKHWHPAMHEAAHWFVFTTLGGFGRIAVEIHIGQNVGYIKQFNYGRLHPDEELIEALTALAGPVCDNILLDKVPRLCGDMQKAKCFLRTKEELELAWNKLESIGRQ